MSDPSHDDQRRRLSAELRVAQARFTLHAKQAARGDLDHALRAAEECKRAKELQIAIAALESK